MKRLLLVLCLLSPSIPLLAQQGETGGLQFIAPMQIGVGSDSNFLVNRTDPTAPVPNIRPVLLDDKFFQVTFPKLGYLDDSRRHELTATWLPEVEMYLHNSDQNAFDQQATVDFRY